MNRNRLSFLFVFLFLIKPLSGEEPSLKELIDQLTEVSQPGMGYAGYFSGSEFLPYDTPSRPTMFVLGPGFGARSETLKKIVTRGAEAVPLLIEHIGDSRKVKIKPMSGMMWMRFPDEYDF